LSTLPKLNELVVNFRYSSICNNEGLSIIGKGITGLSQLSILDLNFQAYNHEGITDEGFEKLAEGLSILSKISTIRLNLEGYKAITDKSAIKFGAAASNLAQLTNLSLKFSGPAITDEGLISFGGLANLKALESVDVRFSDAKWTDECKDKMCTALNQVCKSVNIGN